MSPAPARLASPRIAAIFSSTPRYLLPTEMLLDGCRWLVAAGRALFCSGCWLLRLWLGCLRLGWLVVVGLAPSLAGAAGGLGGVAWSLVCLVGGAGGGWGAGLPLCWRLFAFVGFILCRPG